jgi:hypothetical protein
MIQDDKQKFYPLYLSEQQQVDRGILFDGALATLHQETRIHILSAHKLAHGIFHNAPPDLLSSRSVLGGYAGDCTSGGVCKVNGDPPLPALRYD